MALLDRLNVGGNQKSQTTTAPLNFQAVVAWLAYRQTELTDPDASVDSEFTDDGSTEVEHKPGVTKISKVQQQADEPAHQSARKTVGLSIFDMLVDGAGMSGRTNKVADTCYGFWVGASLHVLQKPELYDHSAMRRYLLGKTQHQVLGGLGKFPGDLPDLLHSYLGIAALSLAGGEDIKELDASMCISKDAKARLPALWKQWEASH
jgi:geranylgeranyl transferase type-1 subunit beta